MPRLLDLFCGAGGCSAGYHRAGFDVVGVDAARQPRYPFDFVRADALEFLSAHGREFDAVHASPPCQRYSKCAFIPERKRSSYPDLLPAVRAELIRLGVPWVIENVETAPMGGVTLCGGMFGLQVYRHRRFETSFLLFEPHHPPHRRTICKDRGRRLAMWQDLDEAGVLTVAGNTYRLADGRRAMGIDWMRKRELSEAIPPAYTEYVGGQLMAYLRHREESTNASSP